MSTTTIPDAIRARLVHRLRLEGRALCLRPLPVPAGAAAVMVSAGDRTGSSCRAAGGTRANSVGDRFANGAG